MQLSVVTDRLGSLAADLDSLSAGFEAVAQRRVAFVGHADARHVEDGLREFFGKWTDGMDRLDRQLSTLASDLHQTVASYETTERAIVDSASAKG